MEQRGSVLLKLIDQRIGPILLCFLGAALWAKRRLQPYMGVQDQPVLVVCFGAIGDLIVLTEAVKYTLAGKRVYLACSQLNSPCAMLVKETYAGVEIVSLKDLLAIHKICQKLGVRQIFDSTQWANIGPIQVGIAELLGTVVKTIGFRTSGFGRNHAYGQTVSHSSVIHELGNFANLLAGAEEISSNAQLPIIVPRLYSGPTRRKSGKVLFHMWPSGNRSYLKQWPEAHWIALARHMVAQGYTIYLSGAPSDKVATDGFLRKLNLPQVFSIAGEYGLSRLSEFVAVEIEFAVSVNTGILHLVAIAGVPVIGLHGGVNPVRWGPLGSASVSLLPQSGKSAYLNYGFEYPKDDVEAYSLDKLTVDQVIAAVTELRGTISP